MLFLNNNQLKQLPAKLFDSSKRLLYINLDDNKLKQLPKNLLSHKYLTYISVMNNELEKMDEEALQARLGASDDVTFEQ
uniref:Leucine-rich repeat-containing protein 1 n=1 Tax=Panagrellus redivivus TaxID=6233 RepID=A0A7E4UZ38_PANRE